MSTFHSRFSILLFCFHRNHTLDHAASQHQADELIALAEAQRKDDMDTMRGSDLTYHTLCQLLSDRADIALTSTLGPDDWRLLATTARREGVAPLLYYILNEASWVTDVPLDAQSELRQSYYVTAARSLLIYQELSCILTALYSFPHHPPIIVLKGAALAITLYPSIALRPMADLDLLVGRQHLEVAVQAMQSLGYREVYPGMSRELNRLADLHVQMRGGPNQGVTVELHWNLVGGNTDWRKPPLDWFWNQTEPFDLRGLSDSLASPLPHTSTPLLALTPTAHLLYLAAHLVLQHGGGQSRLRWFYDLHLMISRYENRLHWDELLARAREFRWVVALCAALQGTQNRFATPMPGGFLDALPQVCDLQNVRPLQYEASPLPTYTAIVWGTLKSLNWWSRLQLAWSIVCPSPLHLRWYYKPRWAWLWPLYYLHRWFDILREGLTTLWRMASSRSQEERTGIHH